MEKFILLDSYSKKKYDYEIDRCDAMLDQYIKYINKIKSQCSISKTIQLDYCHKLNNKYELIELKQYIKNATIKFLLDGYPCYINFIMEYAMTTPQDVHIVRAIIDKSEFTFTEFVTYMKNCILKKVKY